MNIASGLSLKDGLAPHPGAVPATVAVTLDATARAALAHSVQLACRRVAPLWPLKHFVAVNPFLGMSDQRFDEAAATLARVAGARMAMPRAFYREQLAAGRIGKDDLAAALVDAGLDLSTEALEKSLQEDAAPMRQVLTVADVLDALERRRGGRPAAGVARAAFVTERISSFCAAYFDDGQASWRLPWRNQPLFRAWKATAGIDLSAEASGIPGFRRAAVAIPDDALQAIAWALRTLHVPAKAKDDYLHTALRSIGGWAAWARYHLWQQELQGGSDQAMTDLLAIRLAWDALLYQCLHDAALDCAWQRALADADAARQGPDIDTQIDLVLQCAFEAGYRKQLAQRLAQPAAAPAPLRPAVQAVFCIDVRSEMFRRAFEHVAPRAQTLGFAGFFGLAIDYLPLGAGSGRAQCPVLLAPGIKVEEGVPGDAAAERSLRARLARRQRTGTLWNRFKTSAVSCFPFVESFGPLFAFKLLGSSFGAARPVAVPLSGNAHRDAARKLAPRIGSTGSHACCGNGHDDGLPLGQRIDTAEKILRGMSLTQHFARLVMLVGHGSSTVNNPHATSLDCGACGGHTGEANARLAAELLNDARVRNGLAGRGIAVPDDTVFIAALHDTTTDEVALFDTDTLPASHAQDLAQLRHWLLAAGKQARRLRAPRLGIDAGSEPDDRIDAAIRTRSRDWAQVRPEWGLAGNAAFIAAPRSRTRGIDLAGRCFLHEYDWHSDNDFSVLELIMTAPMVVASWINLQYYGSTVDNVAFGCGNKVLHNVVGATVGVLEGNGGDLRTGLPLQSLHDGRKWVHEPVRLNVVIDAPRDAIDAVLARHASVRQLVDNGWVHLMQLDGDGICHQWQGPQQWTEAAS